jgi:hypothetical protein
MLVFVLINGIIFAQNYSKVATNINLRLIEGTAISVIGHRLQPEQFSKMAQPQVVVQNSDYILVRVIGRNIENLLIDYKFANSMDNYKLKQSMADRIIGKRSRLEYKIGKEFYFFITKPFSDSESLVVENNHNKICYLSMVFN